LHESSHEKESSGAFQSKLRRPEVLALLVILIISFSVVYSQILTMPRVPEGRPRNIIGIMRVEGYVETPLAVGQYTDIINQAMLNDSVKAVVLVIDSGGGYADYVEEIYLDLLELKTRNKPVVASVITALSGGYYIAVAADRIFALPTSFVGSIGVIGIGPPILIPSESVLETGPYKVTGFSRLLFSFNLSHALDNFVSAVQANRGDRLKLSSTQLKRAMIYLGSEGLEAGLVDEVGSLQRAISWAVNETKLTQYEVVELRPLTLGLNSSWQGSSDYASGESTNLTLQVLDELHPPPAIHYIYLPPQVIAQSSYPPKPLATPSTGSGNVLVDLSHGNQASWWDLDILIAELAARNITVSVASQRYDLETRLSDATCLIVASPTEVYTDDESDRIAEFIRKGGMLVMFFDPAWEYIGPEGLVQGIIAPINSLAIRFGLSFAKGYLYNEEEHFGSYRNIYVRDFKSSQLTLNLDSLVLFTGTHIRPTGEGLAWTADNTYSSVAEKADSYSTLAIAKKENGTVIAFGDLTFLSEPYCYVDDNYQLILNLASIIAGTQPPIHGEEDFEEPVARPDLPVGTEKNFTEWVDGKERPFRWLKVSETETRIELPNQTTHYYLTEDGALRRWVSDGMECIYQVPLPEPPFPLTGGKRWTYESNYTLTIEGKAHDGNIAGEEAVEGFEDVTAGDGETYYCARVGYREVEQLLYNGANMTTVTTGRYWVSYEAGTVKQEAITDLYVDGAFAGRETRTLLLKSIRKGQGL